MPVHALNLHPGDVIEVDAWRLRVDAGPVDAEGRIVASPTAEIVVRLDEVTRIRAVEHDGVRTEFRPNSRIRRENGSFVVVEPTWAVDFDVTDPPKPTPDPDPRPQPPKPGEPEPPIS